LFYLARIYETHFFETPLLLFKKFKQIA